MENKIDNKMNEMKNKMDENMQKSTMEFQNSLSSTMFHALDDRLSKGDIKMQ
jgi:hypothetical protein